MSRDVRLLSYRLHKHSVIYLSERCATKQGLFDTMMIKWKGPIIVVSDYFKLNSITKLFCNKYWYYRKHFYKCCGYINGSNLP